jgi:hypothetical protein
MLTTNGHPRAEGFADNIAPYMSECTEASGDYPSFEVRRGLCVLQPRYLGTYLGILGIY